MYGGVRQLRKQDNKFKTIETSQSQNPYIRDLLQCAAGDLRLFTLHIGLHDIINLNISVEYCPSFLFQLKSLGKMEGIFKT